MDTHESLSDVQREYGLRLTTFVNVSRVTVAYHCEQDNNEHTIAVTNGPNTIYLTGTVNDLVEFVEALGAEVTEADGPVFGDETDAV